MLAHIKEVVKYANKHKCAIGAFNTSNLETTLGIVRAAVKMKMPVIVQISEATIKYAGLKTIANIVEVIAKDEANNVPIALHLDHGRSFQSIVACIHAGFTSVHMDASNLPFDENIALTAQAAKYAHKHGVWAQGELGAMIGKEGMTVLDVPKDPEEYMTNPRQVRQFVEKTGIDTLAVSVGTMHGLFKGLEKIDFKRLTEISKKVKTPLVLHGASGIGDTPIRRSIKLGVRIINIDTELRQAFTETLRQTIKATEGSTTFDPRKILAPSIDAVQKVVEHKIKVFGLLKK